MDPTELSSSMLAALLLLAVSLLRVLGLPAPTSRQILDTLGVAHATAYARRRTLVEDLLRLDRGQGRPRKCAEPPSESNDTSPVSLAILDFLMDHPGAVSGSPERRTYTIAFKRRVLALAEAHPDLSAAAVARAVGVPEETLRAWLRGPPPSKEQEAPGSEGLDLPGLDLLVRARRAWDGPFQPFCIHVREHLGLPLSDGLIRQLLFAEDERRPLGFDKPHRDKEAVRGLVETFFPGAQWVVDGKKLEVRVGDQVFSFNLELVVDMASSALVGGCLSDQEDTAAVVAALADAVHTTGDQPLALLVDGHPANLSAEVEAALASGLRIRASVRRAETKAHIEGGAFSLFSQVLPELVVPDTDPRTIAAALATAVILTWARTLNHRVRPLRGKSRVQLYRDADPTPEEQAQAQSRLAYRKRAQDRVHGPGRSHLDPRLAPLVAASLEELGLDDPEGRYLRMLGTWSSDAVLAGLATFRGLRVVDKLPEEAGLDYLAGIVRNIDHQDQGWALALELVSLRKRARSALFTTLCSQRARILDQDDPVEDLLDLVIHSERQLERAFWAECLAGHVHAHPVEVHERLYLRLVRLVWIQRGLSRSRGELLTRRLAALIFPVE